tara:strand:+ start:1004 stop:1465 length:462 start_codon:yes stop_codon:yes gene_type:complete
MMNELKTQWAQSSILIKIVNTISLLLLFLSLISFSLSSTINLNDNLENELNVLQKQLNTIEEFDRIFSGKWRHFLNPQINTSDLQSDLTELGLSNFSIKYENKIFNLNGQIASIKKLTSFISYIYNSRGLVIDKLHIDVISEDLISIDLDLIY